MNNELFKIAFNKNDGTINSIKIICDEHDMNWCIEGGRWGYVHSINYDNLYGDYMVIPEESKREAHALKDIRF